MLLLVAECEAFFQANGEMQSGGGCAHRVDFLKYFPTKIGTLD
jgi:hypothetical protein